MIELTITDYEQWVQREAGRAVEQMRGDAMAGIFGKSLFFTPSKAGQWAKTELAFEAPEGATDVIRFRACGGLTSQISAVPYLSVLPQLREACRSMPVYPQ